MNLRYWWHFKVRKGQTRYAKSMFGQPQEGGIGGIVTQTDVVSITKSVTSSETIYWLNYPEQCWHASYGAEDFAWIDLWKLRELESNG